MRRSFAALAIAIAVISAARADETADDALSNALSAQPGVAFRSGTERGVSFEEWTKNGVSYHRERHGSQDRWIGNDNTGAGAVMCTWMIFVTLQSALAGCPADRFVDVRADLADATRRMEDFIVTNSVLPTSLAELRARAAAEDARLRTEPTFTPGVCPAGDIGAMAASIDGMGRPARRAMVDRLLAVPRWPVENPCL